MTEYNEQRVKEAIASGRSNGEMANDLGVSERTMRRWKAKLAMSGYSPEHQMTRQVPDPFMVKGTSQLYRRGEAEPVLEWVKTRVNPEKHREMLEAAYDAFFEDIPQYGPASLKADTIESLMAVYPIGDAHIGMRAWGVETQGQDWDMQIAERVQCGAMAALVDLAPATDTAVIVNCGDWFHADNIEGVTSRSGHTLELDGRYAKMISVGIKVMRQCIDSALAKHRVVRVISAIGNHDDTGAMWLSVALKHAYEKEPRVEIDDSPAAFHYFEHGKCLVGVHHGHSCKPERLPGVMATDQAKAWGRTEHRYFYLGHVHHQSVKEYSGVTIESFNTLTAKDSYAAFGGYRAKQNMKCIVLHKEFGEVSRHTVSPEMLH